MEKLFIIAIEGKATKFDLAEIQKVCVDKKVVEDNEYKLGAYVEVSGEEEAITIIDALRGKLIKRYHTSLHYMDGDSKWLELNL